MISVPGKKTSLEEVQQVKLVRPESALSYWRGISHKDMLGTLMSSIEERNWAMEDMEFALSKSKSDLAAAFVLKVPGVAAPRGQVLCLGLITGNNRRLQTKIAAGTKVVVCGNGVVT